MNDSRITRRDLLKGAAAGRRRSLRHHLDRAGQCRHAAGQRTGHARAHRRRHPRAGLYDFLQCKGMQSVAVADAYKDRREAYARMIKGKAYADFRDLLARNDIDAVIIATPDHWHVPIAIAAARAKKDVYVREAAGREIEQDLACLKVFRETGRIFQYGTQQRSMPTLPLRLRVGPQRADRQGAYDRSDCAERLGGRIDQGDPRAADARLRHVAAARRRCPLHGRPLPNPGTSSSTTTRSAIWPAGALTPGHHDLGQRLRSWPAR